MLAAVSVTEAEPVSLLVGKLKIDISDGFVADREAKSSKQSIADFKGRNSDGWGAVLRGTHGLQPDALSNYMDKKVAEYQRVIVAAAPQLVEGPSRTGIMVTIGGRKWADMRFIAPRENAKDALDGLMYTRILATSYSGQLLEIMFTSNTDPNRATKDKIDKAVESARLEN